MALQGYTIFVERTVEGQGMQNPSLSFGLFSQEIEVLTGAHTPRRGQKSSSNERGEANAPNPPSHPQLYILITNKNTLKPEGDVCSFTSQAQVHSDLETLQHCPSESLANAQKTNSDVSPPLSIAVHFTSGYWYPYIHNGYIYSLREDESQPTKLTSLELLRNYPSITIEDDTSLAVMCVSTGTRALHPLLGVEEVVGRLFLPKLQTVATSTAPVTGHTPRSAEQDWCELYLDLIKARQFN